MRCRALLATAACLTLLAGCGTSIEAMAPEFSGRHDAPAPLTLRVQPVADVPFAIRPAGTPTGAEFRETLVRAFRKANLYRAVVTDGDADLVLQATIASAAYLPPASGRHWEIRRQYIVVYELRDARGNIVWSDQVRSVAGSTALGGAKRVIESTEASVRENVRALVTQAAEHWPRAK